MLCRQDWPALLTTYSFATEGVGLSVVALVGVAANCISVAILCQRTMKSHISALLITLAVFDILFLFCTFPVFAISSVSAFVEHLNTCVYPDGKLMHEKVICQALYLCSNLFKSTLHACKLC